MTRIKGKGGFTTVHYFLGFLGKWLTKGGCFKPETIRTTREIIPHHFSYLGLVVLEKLMNKQTNTYTALSTPTVHLISILYTLTLDSMLHTLH